MNSLIIPVYRNEASIPRLIAAIEGIAAASGGTFEAVFVVDGSPDRSFLVLQEALALATFESQLVLLSRNFGSFAAIRAGLEVARGDCYAVMAADLQEPPELIVDFFRVLRADEADVVVGTRRQREDPWLSRLFSSMFWTLFRRLVMPEVPPGGVDVFGCNRAFRDELLKLNEARSSLIGQLYWLGFRRTTLEYDRQRRQEGKSAWSIRRKLDYLFDSLYAFSDLPIRLLLTLGTLCLLAAAALALAAVVGRLSGMIAVPGYTATLIVVLAFGGLNALGLGIVGVYAWRAYENTKARALAIVMSRQLFSRGNDDNGLDR
jgi:glycosyltransferase involved in cell wall biosynthesis